MGQRERVRQAIEAPVSDANKLLEDLQNADSETRMSILISGWGRGLAAGLEELAIAVDELQQQNADTTSVPTATSTSITSARTSGGQRKSPPASGEAEPVKSLADSAGRRIAAI